MHQYEQIARPMLNTFNVGLKPGKPMERFNWSISDDFDLFQVGPAREASYWPSRKLCSAPRRPG